MQPLTKIVLVILTMTLAFHSSTSFSQSFNTGGKLTYYADGALETQACLFDSIPANQAPFGYYAAVGPTEFSARCGQFIELDTSDGCGSSLPTCPTDQFLKRNKIKVMITNLCPECPPGHFDLGTVAMQALVTPGQELNVGVIESVKWRYVDGEHESNMFLTTRPGVSQFYFAGVFQRHNKFITKVELRNGGSNTWVEIDKQAGQNFYVYNPPSPLVAPLSLRVTSEDNTIVLAESLITRFTENTRFDLGSNFTEPAESSSLEVLPAILNSLIE